MSNKSDDMKRYISTGKIHVQVEINKTEYSVDFSPDEDHKVTYELKHKYAVFLESIPSTCDCKKPEVNCKVKPLNNGTVELRMKKELWEKALSDCAIEQTKIDVFVDENLELIGYRIPAKQSLD